MLLDRRMFYHRSIFRSVFQLVEGAVDGESSFDLLRTLLCNNLGCDCRETGAMA